VHNNYFFLRTLTPRIEARMHGSVVSECFSQNKDELVIRFEATNDPLFLRAVFGPFACLSFPGVFHRTRRNSVDLFPDLIGRRVTGIRQFKNERSFALNLSDGLSLLFKMHGNRSNCILFEHEKVTSVFNQSIASDLAIDPATLDRDIDWSYETFVKNRDRLEAHYFTFGKVVWKYLGIHGFGNKSSNEQWAAIQQVLRILDAPTYYVTEIEKKVTLSLLPFPTSIKEFNDPIEALNYFYITYAQYEALSSERNSVMSRLKSNLRSSESYHQKSLHRLESLQHNNYKIWADLIMANLHAIGGKSDNVTLSNFYDENRPLDIHLKKELSPQKNAEIYYKKAKKQQVEVQMLQQSLEKKEQEMTMLRNQIQEATAIGDIKKLRSFISSAGIREKAQTVEPRPYHEFEFNGFRILVGKNAQTNDTLTLRHSFKDDLWLHAKDVAGSHVLIKHQAGKKIPKDVIERAAQLAAYYSKRKNETLCPVVVTPKKFVRKRKGDPAGMVVVEKEDTILVEPKAWS
jgi:predicted ribosome quality control (RQC) complex YloA/Tae2 family protein